MTAPVLRAYIRSPKSCYLRRNELPAAVRPFLQKGFLVGSAARWLIGETDETPVDFDILVQPGDWTELARLIPRGTPANSFGGFKLIVGGCIIDIWVQDLVHHLICNGDLAVRPFDGNGFALRLTEPFVKPKRLKPKKRKRGPNGRSNRKNSRGGSRRS